MATSRYIQDNLLPWRVLRLFCKFTTPAKNKHMLLVCTNPRPLLFMVNSQIHPYIRSKPYLKSCQVLLSVDQHFFLAHDSYVDCRNACTTFSKTDILTQLRADERRMKGFISEQAQEQVIAAIKFCPVLEKHYKNSILAEVADL
jgi:hypothetical protein